MKTKTNYFFMASIVLVLTLIYSIVMDNMDVSSHTGGARVIDIKKVGTWIGTGRLSDYEAMFYRKKDGR